MTGVCYGANISVILMAMKEMKELKLIKGVAQIANFFDVEYVRKQKKNSFLLRMGLIYIV